jgi:HEAT repeat protein
MQEPGAVDGLIEALCDRNDVVRQAVASALEAMSGPAVRGLIKTLQTRNATLCRAAAAMLERIGTPEAVEAASAWRSKNP